MARAREEASVPSVRLSDGTLARVVPSPYGGGWELDVDGTPQSHVDLDDPTHLHFEYIARMGAVIDRLRMPGQPLTAIHLGAGALTIPRYIEATRPGSRQQVVELEPALWDLVRENLPLPRHPQPVDHRSHAGDVLEVQMGRIVEVDVGLRGAVDVELPPAAELRAHHAGEGAVRQAHGWDGCLFPRACHGSTVSAPGPRVPPRCHEGWVPAPGCGVS